MPCQHTQQARRRAQLFQFHRRRGVMLAEHKGGEEVANETPSELGDVQELKLVPNQDSGAIPGMPL